MSEIQPSAGLRPSDVIDDVFYVIAEGCPNPFLVLAFDGDFQRPSRHLRTENRFVWQVVLIAVIYCICSSDKFEHKKTAQSLIELPYCC